MEEYEVARDKRKRKMHGEYLGIPIGKLLHMRPEQ